MAKFPILCARVSAVLACLAGLMSAAGAVAADDPESAPTGTPAGFVDVTEAVGLSYRVEAGNEEDAAELSEGGREDGGLALADIDGDGWPELYVAHGAGETGRLFGWNGRRFVRSARNGGIAPAAMDRAGYFIDLDDDGVPDFLSIHAAGTQAFRNDGSGRFTELPAPFGTGAEGTVYSLAAADYDGEGDLDPFLAHYLPGPVRAETSVARRWSLPDRAIPTSPTPTTGNPSTCSCSSASRASWRTTFPRS